MDHTQRLPNDVVRDVLLETFVREPPYILAASFVCKRWRNCALRILTRQKESMFRPQDHNRFFTFVITQASRRGEQNLVLWLYSFLHGELPETSWLIDVGQYRIAEWAKQLVHDAIERDDMPELKALEQNRRESVLSDLFDIVGRCKALGRAHMLQWLKESEYDLEVIDEETSAKQRHHLLRAIAFDKLDDAAALIRSGGRSVKEFSTTAGVLRTAAVSASVAMLKQLLEAGPPLGAIRTAFVAATNANRFDTVRVLADTLVSKGEKLDDALNCSLAVRSPEMEQLLVTRYGVSTEAVDCNGVTMLLPACETGDCQHVRFLLQHGADVKHPQAGGLARFLRYAASGGSAAVINLLLSLPHFNQTPIDDFRDARGGTPLFCASTEEAVRALVRAGASVSAMNVSPWTPLHSACSQFSGATVGALIDLGADINALSAGDKPIHVATAHGNSEALRVLLARGVDPNLKNDHGRTPLHMCFGSFWLQRSLLTTIRVLLHAGANPNATDENAQTPLHLLQTPSVTKRDDVHRAAIRMLLAAGADVTLKDKGGKTPLEAVGARTKKLLTEELERMQTTAHSPRNDLTSE